MIEFSAVICNRNRNSQKQISIEFPIPDSRYAETVDALEQMGIGSATEQDCHICRINSNFSALSKMVGMDANLDELNFLAKRMDSFMSDEATEFQACLEAIDIDNIVDIINLTFCCEQVTVISNFENLEAIGKSHAMTLNGGHMPLEEYEKLDGTAIARELIRNGAPVVTTHGVIYFNHMELEPVYDGSQFPQYLYSRSLLALESPSGTNYYLPSPQREIERLMERAGSEEYDLAFNTLPSYIESIVETNEASIIELNSMCNALSVLGKDELSKLNAIAPYFEAENAGQIETMARNLRYFEFVPGVKDAGEYGRYLIRDSYEYAYDSELDEFYDFDGFGKYRAEKQNGIFTENGYLAYTGDIPLEELGLQAQRGSDIQLGGMM